MRLIYGTCSPKKVMTKLSSKLFLFINKVKSNFFYTFINLKTYFSYINNLFKYNSEILKYVHHNHTNKAIYYWHLFGINNNCTDNVIKLKPA